MKQKTETTKKNKSLIMMNLVTELLNSKLKLTEKILSIIPLYYQKKKKVLKIFS